MKGLTIAIAMLALCGCATTIEPVIKTTHISDLMRSPPEPTTDYVGAGVTVSWRHVEIDLTHGTKARDCHRMRCDWESGSEITVRTYPFRRRD